MADIVRSRFRREIPILVFCSMAAWVLCFRAFPQNQPTDAAEVSRNLLYLAPNRIERGPSKDEPETLFAAEWFVYRYVERRGWQVSASKDTSSKTAPERKAKRTVEFLGESYTLTPASDDDRATLTLSREGETEPLVMAVLWSRDELAEAWLPFLQRERKELTRASLQQDLEVGDAVITSVEAQGDSLWVALGHSVGEGELGLGSVVRYSPKTKQARVFHPPALATCDVTHLISYGAGEILLGTRRQHEGTISPCAGLVMLDAANGQAQSVGPTSRGIVTALGATDRVWVATDSTICGGAPEGAWQCARVVPKVHLMAETPASNLPGDKPSGKLAAGDYEVLWANAGFLEVATKDSLDAWLAEDDFRDLVARRFDAEPYKLLNTGNGGPAPVRLLTKPGGDPLGGALVFRAPLEKLPTPQSAPPGWVRVRARIAWIDRGDLEVVPALQPLAGKETP
ncbi:MAG TPA: hypothetical protein VEU31_01555 [Candidatus Acidoferrales bacterium]|nr:hypothetical protein [Candidatus Acidoferrales bacterium]